MVHPGAPSGKAFGAIYTKIVLRNVLVVGKLANIKVLCRLRFSTLDTRVRAWEGHGKACNQPVHNPQRG